MKISPLDNSQYLSGEFKIKNPQFRKTKNNHTYLIFEIKLDLLPVKVIAWQNTCKGVTSICHGQRISMKGKWEIFNGVRQIRCHFLQLEDKNIKEIEQAKIRLRVIFSWLQDDCLKQFLVSIFKDDSIIEDFSTVPASLSHHHAYRGGLLVHSVDVAWKLFNLQSFSSRELSLAVVAGLFHDLGKIKTISNKMKRTQLGSLVKHELLTLEILSPHLKLLDKDDIELSNSLRNLLTWKPNNYDPIPKLDIYDAIQTADRLSASYN